MTEYEQACIRYWAVEYALKANGNGTNSPKEISMSRLIDNAKDPEIYLLDRKEAPVIALVKKDETPDLTA